MQYGIAKDGSLNLNLTLMKTLVRILPVVMLTKF